jgi:hypothetical protein
VDATVGGLRRIVQPFRVSINAKGGYCCNIYRKSVLVIDGNNNNDDGIFIGKNKNEPKLEKLRRDSAELHADSAVLHAECKCAPALREIFFQSSGEIAL